MKNESLPSDYRVRISRLISIMSREIIFTILLFSFFPAVNFFLKGEFSKWMLVVPMMVTALICYSLLKYKTSPKNIKSILQLLDANYVSLSVVFLWGLWVWGSREELSWLYTEYVPIYIVIFLFSGLLYVRHYQLPHYFKKQIQSVLSEENESFITEAELYGLIYTPAGYHYKPSKYALALAGSVSMAAVIPSMAGYGQYVMYPAFLIFVVFGAWLFVVAVVRQFYLVKCKQLAGFQVKLSVINVPNKTN